LASVNSYNLSEAITIRPSILSGELRLPPSKSHAIRWLCLASMDKEPTKIGMWEIGEDVQAMIDCLIMMGADWNGEVLTGGDIKTPTEILDCKNSGTSLRILIGQCATHSEQITLDGDYSLRTRSSLHLIKALGVKFKSQSESSEYPLTLEGPFSKSEVEIDVSKTSQFHSSLMLMAPRTNGFDIIPKGDAVSRNHSNLTWKLCKVTGATEPGKPWIVKCPDVILPPDASMMSFAKLANLAVENPATRQENLGHDLENTILRDSNDLITPMAAWLALGKGGVISHASHAAFKESNRVIKTAELLSAFGLKAEITDDGLEIAGNQKPTTPKSIVKTYNDHRIQMTAVLLASITGGTIEGKYLHRVAWPSYIEQLVECGLQLD